MKKPVYFIMKIIAILSMIISITWMLFIGIGSIGCILNPEKYHWGTFEYAFSIITFCIGCVALWYSIRLSKLTKQARIVVSTFAYPDSDQQVLMQLLKCNEITLPIILYKCISYHLFTDEFISLYLLPLLSPTQTNS